MGHCSCCPLGRARKASVDSLSMDTQNPSVEVELPAAGRRGKKFNSSQISMLKKQESVYFRQTHRLNIDTDSINSKTIPLIAHNHPLPLREHPPHPRGELLTSVKQKLKPHLQKTSTMDEETSRENHYNNRDNFSDSGQQEDSLAESHEPREEERGNMTFSERREAVALGRQFQTNQEAAQEAGGKEEIEKLEGQLREEGMGGEARCEVLHKLAKRLCEEGRYEEGQARLEEARELLSQAGSSGLKFEVLSLLGWLLLLRELPSEAVQPLLKAVRLEVAGEGAESARLVEPYYWLGEAYLRTRRGSLAKEYLLKAQRGYATHGLHDPALLQNIHLQLGLLYHSEEEFPEADKHYVRGIRAAEEGQNADKYLELLLRRAENCSAMESYRPAAAAFAAVFRAMRRHNLSGSGLHGQARQSLGAMLRAVAGACISENELVGVIKSVEECEHGLEELQGLRERLKQMRAILYRQ